MSNTAGTLYVVATPIGNLEDISARALRVLAEVDLIAAEDTRHSGRLLSHYGIDTPLSSLHEHNEPAKVPGLLRRLQAGERLALISDAGTPLVSDPGYRLVSAARDAGLAVTPVPGASSITAALSVAGLPTDRFCFEGFLPPKAAARQRRLQALVQEPRSLVFLESSHRIQGALDDLLAVFGAERPAALARELTKFYETVRRAPLGELRDWLLAEPEQRKGEFVLIVQGAPEAERQADEEEARRVMALLLPLLPVKKAAQAAAGITGLARNRLYELGLELQREQG
ncbi:16S rRNA (cytidine(1402)-2'-O)-methyltransferase [Alkalilimnicola sp. S0819]|uniref:16S rRNA (cytidine(1402)-2'-O)-methyltransferase n=1 Tax=Alkalilimnicola sp. S0819 TaxID=2613922 RepID=UPI0012621271|nr:16S rRNA (cytidine(1402)-2'-O)-methyltransferase [Alkalilimnicola sp. S0819]KAB7623847.1 16S rRNA (cytidine(1402)-2'-O)-methyltransferase [Alkalilimnicola sp. S0819]MPQ16723.1 16S rRNA (cytidine(1402)-2'-O)-methyltransferase [Alkalilimnicola sp. S0819]